MKPNNFNKRGRKMITERTGVFNFVVTREQREALREKIAKELKCESGGIADFTVDEKIDELIDRYLHE